MSSVIVPVTPGGKRLKVTGKGHSSIKKVKSSGGKKESLSKDQKHLFSVLGGEMKFALKNRDEDKAAKDEQAKQVAKYDKFLKLLFRPRLEALIVLLDVSENVDVLTSSVVRLFEAKNAVMRLLVYVLRRELSKTEMEETLFRQNTPCTKLMASFLRLVGVPYLRRVFAPLIGPVLIEARKLEVDIKRIQGDEKTKLKIVSKNVQYLGTVCQRFVDAILASQDSLPLAVRELFVLLSKEVAERFPHLRTKSVGMVLFLRYFGPAILAPEKYGLCDTKKEIPLDQRRALILIVKVLQNLASQVHFNPAKEKYMLALNASFIDKNMGALNDYLTKVGTEDRGKHRNTMYAQNVRLCDVHLLAEELRVNWEGVLAAAQKFHFTERELIDPVELAGPEKSSREKKSLVSDVKYCSVEGCQCAKFEAHMWIMGRCRDCEHSPDLHLTEEELLAKEEKEGKDVDGEADALEQALGNVEEMVDVLLDGSDDEATNADSSVSETDAKREGEEGSTSLVVESGEEKSPERERAISATISEETEEDEDAPHTPNILTIELPGMSEGSNFVMDRSDEDGEHAVPDTEHALEPLPERAPALESVPFSPPIVSDRPETAPPGVVAGVALPPPPSAAPAPPPIDIDERPETAPSVMHGVGASESAAAIFGAPSAATVLSDASDSAAAIFGPPLTAAPPPDARASAMAIFGASPPPDASKSAMNIFGGDVAAVTPASSSAQQQGVPKLRITGKGGPLSPGSEASASSLQTGSSKAASPGAQPKRPPRGRMSLLSTKPEEPPKASAESPEASSPPMVESPRSRSSSVGAEASRSRMTRPASSSSASSESQKGKKKSKAKTDKKQKKDAKEREEREKREAIEREEREKREAKEREEREKREAKEREEREKREAKEREEREKREAKEREEREKRERIERMKAEKKGKKGKKSGKDEDTPVPIPLGGHIREERETSASCPAEVLVPGRKLSDGAVLPSDARTDNPLTALAAGRSERRKSIGPVRSSSSVPAPGTSGGSGKRIHQRSSSAHHISRGTLLGGGDATPFSDRRKDTEPPRSVKKPIATLLLASTVKAMIRQYPGWPEFDKYPYIFALRDQLDALPDEIPEELANPTLQNRLQ